MSEDKDFQAAHEIGKIYNSFVEKALLCEFFLDSSLVFVKAAKGYLFLAGVEDKLWLECASGCDKEAGAKLQAQAQAAFASGKNVNAAPFLFIPLVVRNSAIGVACFEKDSGVFTEKESALACDLSCQLAAALKNILLFEDNLKMERLAAIGRTMSMVIHEIKNVIQLARFGDEYLRMGIESNKMEQIKRGQSGIKKAIKEMEGFTYEMLSLSKDYKVRGEPVNLDELFKELAEDLTSRAKQYRVELKFEIDPSFPLVEGENRSLYRMLLNLIKNAIEAANPDKTDSFIKVGARCLSEEDYEMTIEDNGQGMNDEAKAKIFQAFFSTKGEKGTGLGLLIIDRTVKAHAGKIRVDSEFGKGTKFTLTMPKCLPKD